MIIATMLRQNIIAIILFRELFLDLKGKNTARNLFTAMAARVKVDMHTDTIILEEVRLHIQLPKPRKCQRSRYFEDENILMMMSDVARLRR